MDHRQTKEIHDLILRNCDLDANDPGFSQRMSEFFSHKHIYNKNDFSATDQFRDSDFIIDQEIETKVTANKLKATHFKMQNLKML